MHLTLSLSSDFSSSLLISTECTCVVWSFLCCHSTSVQCMMQFSSLLQGLLLEEKTRSVQLNMHHAADSAEGYQLLPKTRNSSKLILCSPVLPTLNLSIKYSHLSSYSRSIWSSLNNVFCISVPHICLYISFVILHHICLHPQGP